MMTKYTRSCEWTTLQPQHLIKMRDFQLDLQLNLIYILVILSLQKTADTNLMSN